MICTALRCTARASRICTRAGREDETGTEEQGKGGKEWVTESCRNKPP